MASMNTRLNIEKLNGNIVQKHGGSKQVGFKQLGPGVETGVHEVHDEKCVWFGVELQRAQGDREAEVFHVSNNDNVVAQRRLEDKQPEEKTNTDYLVKEQEKEYQTGWKIETGIHQKNGLVNETNMTLFAKLASIKQGMLETIKVMCIFLGYHKSIVGNKLWRLDDVSSKVVLYRNIGFNESGEYKKTFIGSGVGTGSMQVFHGFEFEVEPLGDHTFNVELKRMYKEDSNEAAFEVAAVEKIYAHKSLTFNNTVACEVISKWKAGLKDDMDARSDVYVLSNCYRKCSDDSDGYYKSIHQVEILATKDLLDKAKENGLGMEIVQDQSGNNLRVSQSMFYNRKLVQTLLEGHSILSLMGSLSGTVMWKRMMWVCWIRLIVDYRQTYMIFIDSDYAIGRSITVMGRSITRIRAKDSSGCCYRCLVKGYPWPEVPA
ncbi:hypothetical protein Tco_0017312 [Tanacetum coccineum]